MNGTTTTQPERKKGSRFGTFLRVTLASGTLVFGTAALLKQCGPGAPTCPDGTELVCKKLPPPKAETIAKAPQTQETKQPPKAQEKAPPPVKAVTKGPTKVPEKQPEPAPKEPVVTKPEQQDAGPVEDKTACGRKNAKPPTNEQLSALSPVSNAAIEAVMAYAEGILGGEGKKTVKVTIYVCMGTKQVVSISNAGEKKDEVMSTLSELLKDVSPSSAIDTPVIYTVPVPVRQQ